MESVTKTTASDRKVLLALDSLFHTLPSTEVPTGSRCARAIPELHPSYRRAASRLLPLTCAVALA